MQMKKHLVFYDGECGFCDFVVSFLLKVDKKKLFLFAPLQGKTAAQLLADLPAEKKNQDSIVLIENYQTNDAQIYVLGKAALRILWLLGGTWAILGSLNFLPSFLYDWAYRLVAKNRKKLMAKTECRIPPKDQQNQFLE